MGLRSPYLTQPKGNINGVMANDKNEARKKCREYAKRNGLILGDEDTPRYDPNRKEFICKMRGIV